MERKAETDREKRKTERRESKAFSEKDRELDTQRKKKEKKIMKETARQTEGGGEGSNLKKITNVLMLSILRTSTSTAGSFILMAESMAVCKNKTYQNNIKFNSTINSKLTGQ